MSAPSARRGMIALLRGWSSDIEHRLNLSGACYRSEFAIPSTRSAFTTLYEINQMAIEIYKVSKEATFVRFYCQGKFDLSDVVELFADVANRTIESGLNAALVDVIKIDGEPGTLERFQVGDQVANRIRSSGIKFAIYGRDPLTNANDFAILVATNRGIIVQGFTNEAEAVEWLARSGR